MKISAIYVILNCVNGKAYLGSTMNFRKRRNEHLNALEWRRHKNKHLQNAWNKYSSNNFVILEVNEFPNTSGDLLLKKEAEYIKQHKLTDRNFGYNIAEDTRAPMFNRNHTRKTIEKMRLAALNRSDETRKRMSEAAKARFKNKENHPSFNKPGFWAGKKRSDISKRISEANSGKGNPMYGKCGENSPRWKGGPLTIKCDFCGEKFEKSVGSINRNKKLGHKNYCSRICKDKAQRERT